jgi:FMN-dependent oxidoreductase (nitrilotriacetate monooxygenase family)
MTRQMKLIAYLKTGPTATMPGGWRHPKARLNDFLLPSFYEDLARALERGMFDGCFFADSFGIPDVHGGSFRTYVEKGGQISYLDPMLVLPLMARATKHLGIGATLSTTFHPPYLLARMLASLDLISEGRACWNIVTSATDMEARNFGMDGIPPKEQRYDQADEVVEACCALWDSWDEDALVLDPASGTFADPDKIHYSDYRGNYVRTRGPLAMPRSPQRRPVFLQAGSSDRGRDFAARWAEAVFASNAGKANSIAFYDDLKGRMERYGRAPDDCRILASTAVVVGETESIAQEKAAELIALADEELTVATNSAMMGADLSKGIDDTSLSGARGNRGIAGSTERVLQVMRAEQITFAEAARRPRGGMLVGTASSVADQMQDLFEAGGCDGWILWPTVSPWMYEEFAAHVTPELQRRGLLRTAYSGRTMRQNLLAPSS